MGEKPDHWKRGGAVERLRRHANLAYLQARAAPPKNLVVAGLLVVTSLFLVAAAATSGVGLGLREADAPSPVSEAAIAKTYACGDPEVASLLGAVPVLRSGKPSGAKSTKRTKPVGIPASGGRRRITAALAKLERGLNGGWNRSDASVVPLGQNGYVRRDLPVYRAGFDTYDFALQKRPKDGQFSAEQLAGTSYAMVLCLSFNTDHCFPPGDFPKIGRGRKVNLIQASARGRPSNNTNSILLTVNRIQASARGVLGPSRSPSAAPRHRSPALDRSVLRAFACVGHAPRANAARRRISSERGLGLVLGLPRGGAAAAREREIERERE